MATYASVDSAYDADAAQRRLQQTRLQLLPQLEKDRDSMLQKDWQPNADWWGSHPATQSFSEEE